jgi:hypothetical protein
MTDRKKQRLELLCRLREMSVEQARAGHVAALAELESRRGRADETQRRVDSLDIWTVEQLSQGAPVSPELLRQVHLFRGAEQSVLNQMRVDEAKQGELAEDARGELTNRFEELSVAERLMARHTKLLTHQEIRRGFVDLDEAGARKSSQAKE